MSRMVGADPDALDRLAADFDRSAGVLESTAVRVRASVHANPWAGARATRFRNDWDQRHGPMLKRTAGALRTAARQLRVQAQEQRQASSAGGGSTVPSGGAGSDRGQQPWWQSFDPLAGQDDAFNWLAILSGTEQLQTAAALGRLQGTAIGEMLANSGAGKFFNGVATWSGVLGAVASTHDLVVGLTTGDGARTNSGLRGLISSGLATKWPPIGIASAAAELYGSATLPTTQAEFDGTVDRVMRERFGSSYDPADVTMDQADWLSRRYEGVGGALNSVSDGIDYKMAWLGDPAAKAGADFRRWRLENGWGF